MLTTVDLLFSYSSLFIYTFGSIKQYEVRVQGQLRNMLETERYRPTVWQIKHQRWNKKRERLHTALLTFVFS